MSKKCLEKLGETLLLLLKHFAENLLREINFYLWIIEDLRRETSKSHMYSVQISSLNKFRGLHYIDYQVLLLNRRIHGVQ